MRIRLPILFAVLLCTHAATYAHAASFDCSKAQRGIEKLICSDAKLALADEQLGRVYRDELGKLSSSSIGLLRTDQVQWLAWVQEVCRVDNDQPTAAPVSCLLSTYNERTRQLRTIAVRLNGLTFLTRTQYLASPEDAMANRNASAYSGFGVLKASWPVADSVDPQWIAWNKAVEENAFLLAAGGGIHTAKKPLPSEPAWEESLAEGQDSNVLGRLKSVEEDRVTASLNAETMIHGGPHPTEVFQMLTWLLNRERLLQTDDVFAAGTTWQQIIADACWQSVSTGKQRAYLYSQVNGPAAKPLQDVLTDTRNWMLEADGLHINYPEYSIAPRSATPDDTIIPWAQLKPVLAISFVPPQ